MIDFRDIKMHKVGNEFKVRLTATQEQRVRQISRESGESIASTIRNLVRTGLEHENTQPNDLVAQKEISL